MIPLYLFKNREIRFKKWVMRLHLQKFGLFFVSILYTISLQSRQFLKIFYSFEYNYKIRPWLWLFAFKLQNKGYQFLYYHNICEY
jgi:hypothetical protein